MPYAKEAQRDFRFLPGVLLLLVVVVVAELVAPQHLSPRKGIVPASRDEGRGKTLVRLSLEVGFPLGGLSVLTSFEEDVGT